MSSTRLTTANVARPAAIFRPVGSSLRACSSASSERAGKVELHQLIEHDGVVGINCLEKIQLSTPGTLLGAMIAGWFISPMVGISTINQKPTIKTILPVTSFELSDLEGEQGSKKVEAAANTTDYVFEPSASAVLEGLVPHYVHFAVYQMVLESRASEHSARMVAMKNATDNAKQLIKDLTLQYNKVRQAAITTELLEITTAQMALG